MLGGTAGIIAGLGDLAGLGPSSVAGPAPNECLGSMVPTARQPLYGATENGAEVRIAEGLAVVA